MNNFVLKAYKNKDEKTDELLNPIPDIEVDSMKITYDNTCSIEMTMGDGIVISLPYAEISIALNGQIKIENPYFDYNIYKSLINNKKIREIKVVSLATDFYNTNNEYFYVEIKLHNLLMLDIKSNISTDEPLKIYCVCDSRAYYDSI